MNKGFSYQKVIMDNNEQLQLKKNEGSKSKSI